MSQQINWLSSTLLTEVRNRFEPLYRRRLTDLEVEEIAENLTNLLELLLKFEYEKQNGNGI